MALEPQKPVKTRIRMTGQLCVESATYPSAYRFRSHSHVEPGITLVVAGGMEETVNRRSCRPSAGTVLVKPPEHRHAVCFAPGNTRTIAISFRDDYFSDASIERDFSSWYSTDASATRRSAFAVFDALARTDNDWQSCVTELVATLNAQPEDLKSAQDPPAWLAEVATRIADTCLEPLDVDSIATGVQRHPVALARRFRRHYRCSMREFHQYRRASHVISRTASDSIPLTRLAQDAGYHDSSHLNHTFVRLTGLTPSRYRQLNKTFFA